MLERRGVRPLEQLLARPSPRASRGATPRGSCQPVIRPSIARRPRSGVMTSSVQPSPARRRPRVTVSSARTTVVPTAITRPPRVDGVDQLARSRAGTRYHSGYGGSSRSSEETPVWRTIGATRTPLATSRVRSSGVNGRRARHSALPGSFGVDVLVRLERPRRRRSRSGSAGRARRGSGRAAAGAASGASQSRRPSAQRRASSACAPPGSASRSPSSPPVKRSAPSRSSTSQRPSGVGVERRSSSAVPSGARRSRPLREPSPTC